jgi:hypothetical protein
MEGASRSRLVALVVLVVVGGALVAVALAGNGDPSRPGARPAGLRLELVAGDPPQLTIYVDDPALNRLETTGGRRHVMLECLDRDGGVVITSSKAWPFGGTDARASGPHIHIPVQGGELRRIARCRLAGTTPPLGGRMP